MRRLTSVLLASGCLCGSALAQPGNRPPVVGGQFQGSPHVDGIGRPAIRGELSSRPSTGLPSHAAAQEHSRPGAQFGAGTDLSTSASDGFGQQVDGRLSSSARFSSQGRPSYGLRETAETRTVGRVDMDQAFDPATGGLTAAGRSELMLRNRLAAIDRLRNSALEHGDTELLDEADRLEQQARLRFRSPGQIAEPSRHPVHSANYEFDAAARGGVTPASGHPISGFDRDAIGEANMDRRDFGLETASEAALRRREFGTATAAQAAHNGEQRSGAAIPASGQRIAGEWYDVQNQTRPGTSQAAAVSTRSGGRFDSQPLPADDFNRPQFNSQFPAGARAPAQPSAEANPFTTAEALPREAPRYASGLEAAASANVEAAAGAFHQHRPADSYLHRDAEYRNTMPGDGSRHPLRGGAERPERRPEPAGYESEDENTIYFGRPNGPAAVPDFGQNTAVPARADERGFGQAQAAAAQPPAAEFDVDPAGFGQNRATAPRAAGREFGQATAAEARTAGGEFGQRTAADARSWGGATARIPLDESSDEGTSEPIFDDSSAAGIEAERNARRDQAGPAQPAAPSRTEEKPRKRGLFSWFRGRKKDDSR